MQSGETIKVFSTFVSINGEVCQAHQGSICTFVRLAGCNLRCAWCDTEYAQEENSGIEMSVNNLFKLIEGWKNRNVTITGGEPFMQEKALYKLLLKLVAEGYLVSVETNGSYEFMPFDDVDYVVDFKTPSSDEFKMMRIYNPWLELKSTDWIKFVIQDKADYDFAMHKIKWLRGERCFAQFAVSPIITQVSGNKIVDWLKADRIFNVIVSLQLHRLVHLSEPK